MKRCLVAGSRDANIFRSGRVPLKRHKANFHEMDVVYYPCNVNGCSFEAKRVDSLTGYTID